MRGAATTQRHKEAKMLGECAGSLLFMSNFLFEMLAVTNCARMDADLLQLHSN